MGGPPRALVALFALSLSTSGGRFVDLAPVEAAPRISIRTRTDVRLRGVRRRNDGTLVVAGQLIDRATGGGVGGKAILARIDTRVFEVTTTPDGLFETSVPGGAGPGSPFDVTFEFAGDLGFDPARLDERGVDATRASVELTFSIEPTAQGARVTTRATSDGAPVSLPITLRVSADGADEPHREHSASSDTPILIRRAAAFGPGIKRVRARFVGDQARSAASAETTLELTSATKIDLTLLTDTVAFEEPIRTQGRVLDDDGAAVPKITVALMAGHRRLGAATTGPGGRWRIAVDADLLGTGRHLLEAVAETHEPWRSSSRSAPLAVTIGVPRPAPVGITIAAFVATALVALGFVLARRPAARSPARPAPDAASAPEPHGGFEPGRASLVSTLRRSTDHGFEGRVRDTQRKRPVAGAAIMLSTTTATRGEVTSPDGGFAIEGLAPAEWSASVSAPGHVTERFSVTIPHRGEFRGARIDLVPVREKVFSLYRRAALGHLPSPELWGIWSPRQILDHVRAGRPPIALADLTEFVEEAYFSPRTLDERILPIASAKVAAALAERA